MIDTFANRLKTAMTEKNMKLTKLSNITGISKPLISNYLSGNYEPKQANIYKIAKALNISPAWLMGYNVPMETEIKILNNEAFSDVMNDYIFGTELNNMFDKISKELNVPIKELKLIFLSDENQEEKELNYENLLEFFKKHYGNLDTFLSKINLKDIETIVKNDNEKKLISLIDFYDILIYIYADNFELLDKLHNASKEIGSVIDSVINNFNQLKLKKPNIAIKLDQDIMSLSELEEGLLSIKKDELYYYIKKYYSKKDILNEIEKRNIFEITDENNKPILNKDLKLQVIEEYIANLLENITLNNNINDNN